MVVLIGGGLCLLVRKRFFPCRRECFLLEVVVRCFVALVDHSTCRWLFWLWLHKLGIYRPKLDDFKSRRSSGSGRCKPLTRLWRRLGISKTGSSPWNGICKLWHRHWKTSPPHTATWTIRSRCRRDVFHKVLHRNNSKPSTWAASSGILCPSQAICCMLQTEYPCLKRMRF